MVNVATVACDLCGLGVRHPIDGDDGRRFCCAACVEVDRLLSAAPVQTDSPTGAETETVSLTLAGMWCSSCSWAIEETLGRSRGVGDVEVSFVRRQAMVTYDPTVTGPTRLKRSVRRLGYRAWLPEDRVKDEEDALYYRMLISSVFTMNVMMISLSLYASRWLGWWDSPGQADIRSFLEIILLVGALPVVLLLGLPILKAGLISLARGRPNIHTLIAIGAFSAFGLSVRNLITGVDRLYFDTATVLLLLVTFGHWLELRARKRGTEAVDRLWEQMPETATVLTEDGEHVVSPDDVPLGSRVLVRPGERFPVDGIVAVGTGDVDKSLLTGESLPDLTAPGAEVYAGTVSLDAAFEVVTSAVGSLTAAGRVGRLLHDALWQRSAVHRLADRIAAFVVPAAVLIGAATFTFWSWRSGFETGLLNGLAVLLIACPCALGIATPLTAWLAVGRAAENGVIARSFDAIDRLAAVRAVAFDKTGTLTKRPLRLESVLAIGRPEDEVLSLAKAVEARSEHPIAAAITEATSLQPSRADDFVVHPGAGVTGTVAGMPVAVGSLKLLRSLDVELGSTTEDAAGDMERRGSAVVAVAAAGAVAGLIELAERARDDAGPVLRTLRADEIDVAVLTGDSKAAGHRWSAALGVPVTADLTPADKTEAIARLAQPVAMVGDGINDAPSLAAASVGVSVSDAADVARSAADVVIVRDDLLAVPWVIRLSRTAMRKVRQNLAWAFGYNVVGVVLAAAGYLPPVIAAGLMVLSSVVVTTNASALRRFPDVAHERAHQRANEPAGGPADERHG